MDAKTVLEEPADWAFDVGNSVAMVLILVHIGHLLNVGPHVDLDVLVVAASVIFYEASVEGVLLTDTIVVTSDGGVADGKGGGSEECECERRVHFFLKSLLEI